MDPLSLTASDKEVMAAKLQDKIKKRLDAEARGGGGGGARGGGAGGGAGAGGPGAGASARGDGGPKQVPSGDGGSADSGDTGSLTATSDAPKQRLWVLWHCTYSPVGKRKRRKRKILAYGKGIYEAMNQRVRCC